MSPLRIKETIHAGGRSSWTVEWDTGSDRAPEYRWQICCFVETKKEATKYIKDRRDNEVVNTKYHEVAL